MHYNFLDYPHSTPIHLSVPFTMFARPNTNDEERQFTTGDSEEAGARRGMELGPVARPSAQQTGQDCKIPSRFGSFKNFRFSFLHPLKQKEALSAQQSCFLCIRGRAEDYAIRVPCFRPSPRRARREVKQSNAKIEKRTKLVMDSAFESDSTVYKKLLAACYEEQGSWKRWVPFYGIADAREVEVSLHFTHTYSEHC